MYTVDYFIDFYSAIPDKNWICGLFKAGDRCCAQGFLMTESCKENLVVKSMRKNFYISREINPRLHDLLELFEGFGLSIAPVNNGGGRYHQSSPKQRILAALYDIKKLQQPEQPKVVKEYVVVHVADTISEQTKELILS